jgi:two-component system phosphate regulon response regulator PhoB
MDERLEYADLLLDRAEHRVTRAGKDVHLGPTEYRLLDFPDAASGPGVQPRTAADAVWGPNTYVEVRTVDVHVGRLRKALNDPARAI